MRELWDGPSVAKNPVQKQRQATPPKRAWLGPRLGPGRNQSRRVEPAPSLLGTLLSEVVTCEFSFLITQTKTPHTRVQNNPPQSPSLPIRPNPHPKKLSDLTYKTKSRQ